MKLEKLKTLARDPLGLRAIRGELEQLRADVRELRADLSETGGGLALTNDAIATLDCALDDLRGDFDRLEIPDFCDLVSDLRWELEIPEADELRELWREDIISAFHRGGDFS